MTVGAADKQLLKACRYGNLQDAKKALAKGASTKCRPKSQIYNCNYYKGKTPLTIAVAEGHKRIVKLLVEGHGANPIFLRDRSQTRRTKNRCTGLHAAAIGHHFEIVAYLVDHCQIPCLWRTKKKNKTALDLAKETAPEKGKLKDKKRTIQFLEQRMAEEQAMPKQEKKKKAVRASQR